jgi:hypothetical protein
MERLVQPGGQGIGRTVGKKHDDLLGQLTVLGTQLTTGTGPRARRPIAPGSTFGSANMPSRSMQGAEPSR